MAFYFNVQGLDPLDSATLEVIIDHPEFNLPDGSKSTQLKTESILKVNNGQAFNAEGYRLDHDYELVVGKWTFTVKYLGRVLLVKEFETYLP
ncbi:MAG: DUF3859 domain-containing protein [Desulfobulbaceae bacterium]|nr:DUF3859 domain-containing protein [Desulfobulbaceae bacterium]